MFKKKSVHLLLLVASLMLVFGSASIVTAHPNINSNVKAIHQITVNGEKVNIKE